MTQIRLLILTLTLAVAAACSNDATFPSPLQPPGGASGDLTSLSGTVISHLDGSPVAGATLIHGTVSAFTNASGQFTMNGVPAGGVIGVTANASGFVFRRAVFNMTPNRSGVTIDVMQNGPPFEIDFYRMWARDSIQSTSPQATRPWTTNPNFYFRTAVQNLSESAPPETVPDDVIDRVVGVFANSIQELTGGRRQIGTVERGVEEREPIDGWVNVTFSRNLAGVLGRSTVGGNTGTMSLLYSPLLVSSPQNNPFSCDFYMYGIADHEITHTMGFYHTLDLIGDSFSGPGCTGTGRPARTRVHSAFMYARPAGNTDPDVDPASGAQFTAPGFRGPEIACFRQ